MAKKILIFEMVSGLIILLGGLLTYGLGVHEIMPVPRPDLIVVGSTLIGCLLTISGACELFVKKSKAVEIEENDERNIALANAAIGVLLPQSARNVERSDWGNEFSNVF